MFAVIGLSFEYIVTRTTANKEWTAGEQPLLPIVPSPNETVDKLIN